MLHTLLLLLNALVAVALVIAILLQRQDTSGGGIMGGANLGASAVVRNPLAKPTAILAAIFMGSSILLAVMAAGKGKETSVFEEAAPVAEIPAVPATVAPEAQGTVPVPMAVPAAIVPASVTPTATSGTIQ
ncbi:MAG: preprotein translocase subunit SecG [Alphaproteobacteria bacterium]